MVKFWPKYWPSFSNVRKTFPENFSKELVLNFNLGPLKDLGGLIDEVVTLDSAKS